MKSGAELRVSKVLLKGGGGGLLCPRALVEWTRSYPMNMPIDIKMSNMTISNMTIFLKTLKYDYIQYEYFFAQTKCQILR